MKPSKPLLLGALLCGVIWATGLPAQEHAHGHEHAAAHAEAAADGVLHATDAPLRAGMLKIRDLIRAPRPADGATAKTLADGIDAEVQQLFAQRPGVWYLPAARRWISTRSPSRTNTETALCRRPSRCATILSKGTSRPSTQVGMRSALTVTTPAAPVPAPGRGGQVPGGRG